MTNINKGLVALGFTLKLRDDVPPPYAKASGGECTRRLERTHDVPLAAVGDDCDGIVLAIEWLVVTIRAAAALFGDSDSITGCIGFL